MYVLGMFHPNTIFIEKKKLFLNIEGDVSILHNGTAVWNSHLDLCVLIPTSTDMHTPVPKQHPTCVPGDKGIPGTGYLSPSLTLLPHSMTFPVKCLQTHKLWALPSPAQGVSLHCIFARWAPANPAIPRSPESIAQVKPHLHSVTKPPKASAVPSDMKLSSRNERQKRRQREVTVNTGSLFAAFRIVSGDELRDLLPPACNSLAHLIKFPNVIP